MKTICIYHSVDLDGWMSAAIVRHWFIKEHGKDHLEYQWFPQENKINAIYKGAFETLKFEYPEITFLSYNYGQPIPDLSEYDRVVMCDVSFPKEEMDKLLNKLSTNFIWIDHHISAIKANDTELITGIQNTEYAACELTWKYFFPDEAMPEIVRLLGMYDSFRHKGTDEEEDVLEFQYGARQYISSYEDAYNNLLYSLECSESHINDIHKEGKTIYQYLCTEAKQTYKNGFEIEFDERVTGFPNSVEFKTHKFICFNKERFNPVNFGIDYHKDGYNGAACFHYNGTNWGFSLYNDNGEVDCSVIAKQYGGGGHKGAAGFRVNNINEIIK